MDNKCTYCKNKLDKKWNYCPRCGTEISKRVSIFNLLGRQMDILRNLISRDDDYEERIQRPKNAITIRINSSGFGEPHIQVFPKPIEVGTEEPYRVNQPSKRKLPEKIIEPKVDIKRLAREMIITLSLPDIKSENDVDLSIFEDSVEVKAFGKDKGYFKILTVPKNYKLVEKSLNNGSLNLRFAV